MNKFSFLLFFFLMSSAFGKSFFPTREELLSLPPEKRKEWLLQIQSVILDMSESSEFMAFDFEVSSGRSPANTGVPPEVQRLRDERRNEFLSTKGVTPEAYAAIHKRVVSTPRDQRQTPEYQKDYQLWLEAMRYVQKKEDEDRRRERDAEAAAQQALLDIEEAEKQKRLEAQRKRNEEEHQKFLAEQKMSKRERRRLREAEAKERALEEARREKQSDFRKTEIAYLNETTEKKEDLCLFAGWIIEGTACTGPNKMPDSLKFKGIENEQLTCEKGTYLCNPLLFGVKLPSECKSIYFHFGEGDSPCLKKVRPLCTGFSGGSPTRECASLSKNTMDSAVELIGDGNPEAFDQYRSRFFHLCTGQFLEKNKKITEHKKGERLRADVQNTCKVAEARLEEIREKYDRYIPLPPKKKPVQPPAILTETPQR